jgi:uncharacterized protein (DUF433 family)
MPASRYPSRRRLRMTRRLLFWTTCATSASLGGSPLRKRGLRPWSVSGQSIKNSCGVTSIVSHRTLSSATQSKEAAGAEGRGGYGHKSVCGAPCGGYWVADTRVSLDSLVYTFREGQTAESLAQSIPVLTLEQVYGAITYYRANREVIVPLCCSKRRIFPHSNRTCDNGIRCATRSLRMPDDSARQHEHDTSLSGGC